MSNNAAYKQARTRDRLEDVTWLATTGESLTGAAARLDVSVDSLTRWCEKHAPMILSQLRSNETSGKVRRGKVLA